MYLLEKLKASFLSDFVEIWKSASTLEPEFICKALSAYESKSSCKAGHIAILLCFYFIKWALSGVWVSFAIGKEWIFIYVFIHLFINF